MLHLIPLIVLLQPVMRRVQLVMRRVQLVRVQLQGLSLLLQERLELPEVQLVGVYSPLVAVKKLPLALSF